MQLEFVGARRVERIVSFFSTLCEPTFSFWIYLFVLILYLHEVHLCKCFLNISCRLRRIFALRCPRWEKIQRKTAKKWNGIWMAIAVLLTQWKRCQCCVFLINRYSCGRTETARRGYSKNTVFYMHTTRCLWKMPGLVFIMPISKGRRNYWRMQWAAVKKC